jgi:hypothetical protein
MFMMNFKAGIAMCVAGVRHFLAAQTGRACDATLAAHQSHLRDQESSFRSASLAATAQAAAACPK